MNPFVVCAFALASAVIIALLKQIKPEISSLAIAAASLIVFVYVAEGIIPFVDFIKDTAIQSKTENYFTLMLKSLAISLCCRMSAEICRDCGENSLASRVELAGKVSIVVISIPVVKQLLLIAKDMLG